MVSAMVVIVFENIVRPAQFHTISLAIHAHLSRGNDRGCTVKSLMLAFSKAFKLVKNAYNSVKLAPSVFFLTRYFGRKSSDAQYIKGCIR